jgi:hypothetical protein
MYLRRLASSLPLGVPLATVTAATVSQVCMCLYTFMADTFSFQDKINGAQHVPATPAARRRLRPCAGTVKRCPRALAAARARVAAARLAAMSPSSAYCHTIHSPGWMSDCGMPGGCPPGHNILVSRFTMHIRPRPAALTMPCRSRPARALISPLSPSATVPSSAIRLSPP